jgi:hypothetical protein
MNPDDVIKEGDHTLYLLDHGDIAMTNSVLFDSTSQGWINALSSRFTKDITKIFTISCHGGQVPTKAETKVLLGLVGDSEGQAKLRADIESGHSFVDLVAFGLCSKDEVLSSPHDVEVFGGVEANLVDITANSVRKMLRPVKTPDPELEEAQYKLAAENLVKFLKKNGLEVPEAANDKKFIEIVYLSKAFHEYIEEWVKTKPSEEEMHSMIMMFPEDPTALVCAMEGLPFHATQCQKAIQKRIWEDLGYNKAFDKATVGEYEAYAKAMSKDAKVKRIFSWGIEPAIARGGAYAPDEGFQELVFHINDNKELEVEIKEGSYRVSDTFLQMLSAQGVSYVIRPAAADPAPKGSKYYKVRLAHRANRRQ